MVSVLCFAHVCASYGVRGDSLAVVVVNEKFKFCRVSTRSDLTSYHVLLSLVLTKNVWLFVVMSFYSAYLYWSLYTAHELQSMTIAHLSPVAQALKICADELDDENMCR